ncbi:MAG: dUTP diphosphatase [Candidatus Eisenbacteria bacterium]|nr:dUTP diphosphatase [Candidatus Eisenbacteria bacterium]
MAARRSERAKAPRPRDVARRRVRVPVARLGHAADIPVPQYMTPGASGADLCAAVPRRVTIRPGTIRLIPTGLAVAVPSGYEGQVRARSGLALRHGVIVANGPGTVDADYRGEVGVILANIGDRPFAVERGDRIAQLVIVPVVRASWVERAGLEATARDAGGFGHTGRGRSGPSRDGAKRHARRAR